MLFSEYNPKLSSVTPTTRVAYAKFMRSKIKSDFTDREEQKKAAAEGEFTLEDEVFETPKKKDTKNRSSELSLSLSENALFF